MLIVRQLVDQLSVIGASRLELLIATPPDKSKQ